MVVVVMAVTVVVVVMSHTHRASDGAVPLWGFADPRTGHARTPLPPCAAGRWHAAHKPTAATRTPRLPSSGPHVLDLGGSTLYAPNVLTNDPHGRW